jgi:hypothetical protein
VSEALSLSPSTTKKKKEFRCHDQVQFIPENASCPLLENQCNPPYTQAKEKNPEESHNCINSFRKSI